MKVEKLAENEFEALRVVGIEALREAKRVHDKLGKDGLTKVPSPNQFGEQALQVDVYAEKAVLNTLTHYKIPIRVISEEHGITDITANPIYLGVLDGIDGTANFPSGFGYATIFGIFTSLDPHYRDYIFSGMMEHEANKLWYAVAGKGSKVLDLNSGVESPVQPSTTKVFTPSCHIYTSLSYRDTPVGKAFEEFLQPYKTTQPKSAAISYISLASELADLQVEITRKRNLEQMIAYGFLKEAGAAMITLNGNDLGEEQYLQFGQQTFEGIITAANPELAQDFLRKFNNRV